ncbi:MAG: hypothetical protein AAF333_18800 [Planctomycetota bacterium]
MSTATLSKKERKALRKQMMERKEQLLAKHGRGTGKAGDSRLGSSRVFSDIKPKLPGDPPKPKLPSWTPPAQPAPHRTLADTIKPRPSTRRSLRPRVRDTVSPNPATALIRDLDHNGPGPLTRAAAALESGVRHAVRLWRQRPWRDTGESTRAETYRALTLLIKPLRLLGLVTIGGAVVLGRESRGIGISDTGSLVVLGLGLGLAVVLLSLAEIASGLRTVARRI